MKTARRPRIDEYGIRRATLTPRTKIADGDFVTYREPGRSTEIRFKVTGGAGRVLWGVAGEAGMQYTVAAQRKWVTKVEHFSFETKNYGWTVWQ